MTGLYGAAFDRVAASLGGHLDRVLRETMEASILVEELLLQPRERRSERVRSEPRLWLLKVCDGLEAASRRGWAEDPATAVEMAELAVEVAERLDPRSYGEALAGDALALAWAYLGNARRIASDLDRAEEALVRAEQLHRQFEADILTEAEILVFQASLRNTQGSHADGAALLDRALRLYREAGDLHQAGPSAEPRLPLVTHHKPRLVAL